MEEALAALACSCEENDFLRVTSTALKIVQNIQNEPSELKYRRLRSTSAFCSNPQTVDLLQALGFDLRDDYFVLDEIFVSSLSSKKRAILAARKKTGSILGWDVPFSMLKFATALGTCKYGEVFRGVMGEGEGEKEVIMKTLKPDGREVARESFDRELDLLHKLKHPNLVQLQAVTLTSDPTSIILEYVPTSLLKTLNRGELGDEETISVALQTASAMAYLHSQGILHCDLGARNVRLTTARAAILCDLGLARKEDTPTCTLTSDRVGTLPLRWTAPEVLQQLFITKHSDIWSYGVLLYELVTNGAVPYASFSNQQVKSKVTEGYRLPQPHNCPDELYSLMFQCWLPQATERPDFDIIRNHLDSLTIKAHDGRLSRQTSTSEDQSEGKSSTLKSSRSGSNIHKLKVKESSYPQVLGKGGGLLRVYTALISPFHHHVTIVCGKKTTTSDVVQIALAKCGKADLDYKSHSLALVNPHSMETPARYLGSEDRVMAVKNEPAAAGVMFVLCVFSSGSAILEIVNTIKQNPAYSTAFDSRTRGYLVTMETGEGTGKRGKGMSGGDHRSWCVLDGSSLLCYRDEEDEGVKQFESFVDVKSCSVSPLSGKKSSTMVRVGKADGSEFIFSASDKLDMLQWIEAITTASRLEPSTMLLHSGDGIIVQTGLLDCQEFALETDGVNPVQSPPPLNRRLGTSADFSGNYSAVDYGRHWTVLKSSGLMQCLIRGRPETLFSLLDATKVKVHNPRDNRMGAHYYISLYDKVSRIVLQAECPSDHFDWVVAIERVLKEKGLENRLCGDRGKQSGYVTLKRLMKFQEGGKLGHHGSAMQLYAMPRSVNLLDDVYEQPVSPQETCRHDYENRSPSSAQLPHKYENFVPPPPIPPRSAGAPPLPPKGVLRSFSAGSPGVINPNPPDNEDGEYVVMSPQPVPVTPSDPSSRPHPIPTTPNGAYHHHPPSRLGGMAVSQPIKIPAPPLPEKRAKLFPSDSEPSSTSTSTTLDSPLPSGPLPSIAPDWASPMSGQHSQQSSRHPSSSSTSSRHLSSSSTHSHHISSSSSSLHRRQTSETAIATPPSETPPLQSSAHHASSSSSLHRRQTSETAIATPPSETPPLQSSAHHASSSSSIHHQQPSETTLAPPPTVSTHIVTNGEMMAPPPTGSAHMINGELSHSGSPLQGDAGTIPHLINRAASLPPPDGYSSSPTSTDNSTSTLAKLPPGWRKGYCDSKVFFVNTETGSTTWDINDVFAAASATNDKVSNKPGGRWQVVTLEDGQVYYYHEITRQTTWNVQDTF